MVAVFSYPAAVTFPISVVDARDVKIKTTTIIDSGVTHPGNHW